MARILVIDDENSIRAVLRDILEHEGYEIVDVDNGIDALNKIEDEVFDVVLCDIKMPKMDGIEVLEKASEVAPDVPFIMISAHGTIETAVEATKKGAFDFLVKPPDLNRLLITVKNALDKSNLVIQTKKLNKKVARSSKIIGQSKPILDVLQQIEKVAPTDARVLITGPNGAGKELIAKALHEGSLRSKSPLIEVNCAAIPSELIESELFGHEKGAFTSAIKQRIGKFEQANNGTLFLDEIGDMSLPAQAKVLRALQENVINRVGGDKEIKVNVRVIAATNKNLKEEIEKGNFREDLFHRLSVIELKIPSLNERKEDIPLLVDKFLNDIAMEYGTQAKTIENKAIEFLQNQDWTGNIRQLRNVVERLVILSEDIIKERDATKYF